MSESRTPRPAVLGRVVLGLGLVGAVGLGRAALGDSGVPATPAPPALTAGATLYQNSCATCHGQHGEGSQRGPTLVGVGAASADFWLSTGRMPLAQEKAEAQRGRPSFDRVQIDALVQYVASFGGGPPVPQVGEGDAVSGRRLYLLNCAACHSATGIGAAQVGGQAATSLYAATPTQIAEAVRVGPGLMPEFPNSALSDSEVDDIAAYVGSLHRNADHGGATLGLVGPVTETLVGVVGVGLLLLVVRRLGTRAP
jgi:ubiquinol-cytochrome c reductase cytochrome c subunit